MRAGCTSCAQAASVLPSWEREGKQDWGGLSLRWLQLEESPELTSQAQECGGKRRAGNSSSGLGQLALALDPVRRRRGEKSHQAGGRAGPHCSC